MPCFGLINKVTLWFKFLCYKILFLRFNHFKWEKINYGVLPR